LRRFVNPLAWAGGKGGGAKRLSAWLTAEFISEVRLELRDFG
jgi:hypothetical protein